MLHTVLTILFSMPLTHPLSNKRQMSFIKVPISYINIADNAEFFITQSYTTLKDTRLMRIVYELEILFRRFTYIKDRFIYLLSFPSSKASKTNI